MGIGIGIVYFENVKICQCGGFYKLTMIYATNVIEKY